MCDECKEAHKAWDWDGYREDCGGCTIRALAKGQRSDRERYFEMRLQDTGTAGFILLRDEVRREMKRIEQLRQADPQRWWQKTAA